MTTGTTATVVVVGLGHATGELVTALRREGHQGRIIAIGEEPHLPYQRPPLSKAYLSGEIAADSLYLRPHSAYEKAHVEVLTNTRVERIDRTSKHVLLSDGRSIQYGKLVAVKRGLRVTVLEPCHVYLRELQLPSFLNFMSVYTAKAVSTYVPVSLSPVLILKHLGLP